MTAENRLILTNLKKQEQRIEQAGFEVGSALAVIRDEKLYRTEFRTFDEYVKERWKYSVRRAYELIESSQVVEEMCGIPHKTNPPNLPANVSQAKELKDVKPEAREAVMQKANETAAKEKRTTTAKDVRKVAAEVVYEEMPDEPEPAKPATWEPQQMVGPLMSYRKELTQILNKLKKNADERGGEWIDIQALSSAVSNLKALIQSACYYADCHHCGGTGCTRCKASGFLPHLKHRECDEAIDTEGVMF